MKYDVQTYMQLDKFIDMKIHTPEDLLAWMNSNISYGFVDVHGKKYTDFDGETFYNPFRLQSPKQFFENKLGVCWDNVEFVRYVFSRLGITHDTVYLEKDNIEQSTHTFVLYKGEDDKIYHFENAFYKYRGIHGPFNKVEDAISSVNAQIDNDFQLKYKYTYRFIDNMTAGISCEQYMHTCINGRTKSKL